MIDKRKSTRLVKIVAIFLAIAFVSLPLSSLLGGGSSSPSPSPSPQPTADRAVSDADKAAGLVDQGRLFDKQKKYSQAVDYYRDALAADPNNNEVRFLLGRAALSSGDTPLGRQSLQDYLAADPDAPQAAEAKALLGSAQ